VVDYSCKKLKSLDADRNGANFVYSKRSACLVKSMVTDVDHRRNIRRISDAIKASKVRFSNEPQAVVTRPAKKDNVSPRKLHLR
jgi:hypothetical protein